jgi:hypothetical protein
VSALDKWYELINRDTFSEKNFPAQIFLQPSQYYSVKAVRVKFPDLMISDKQILKLIQEELSIMVKT